MLVETVSDEPRVDDPDKLAGYHRLTDTLWTEAVAGEQARVVPARIAAGLTE